MSWLLPHFLYIFFSLFYFPPLNNIHLFFSCYFLSARKLENMRLQLKTCINRQLDDIVKWNKFNWLHLEWNQSFWHLESPQWLTYLFLKMRGCSPVFPAAVNPLLLSIKFHFYRSVRLHFTCNHTLGFYCSILKFSLDRFGIFHWTFFFELIGYYFNFWLL